MSPFWTAMAVVYAPIMLLLTIAFRTERPALQFLVPLFWPVVFFVAVLMMTIRGVPTKGGRR